MRKYTLDRAERLKSSKVIGAMFGQGQSFGQYPLRLIYLPMAERRSDYPVQFTVSVPKKKFPKAVDRNRLRRQVREAWRRHKHRLYQAVGKDAPQFAFLVLYVAKEPLPYSEIEAAMQQMIRRFIRYGLKPA
jgi:ribonuclease P protein component